MTTRTALDAAEARRTRRVRLIVGLCVGMSAIAATLAIFLGAADLAPGDVARVLWSRLTFGLFGPTGVPPVTEKIVWILRMPRVIVGALVGLCLALAGAQMQGLFRNPLASPGVVGTSAGASLGAVLVVSARLDEQSLYYIPLAAVAGALIALVTVVKIAERDRQLPIATLLLAGVALTALFTALNGWVIARSWKDYEVARKISFWSLGGIGDTNWSYVWIILPGAVLGVALAAWDARALDLLLEGEEVAEALGVEVEAVTSRVLIGSAVLTGSAVAVSGVVGFVGLVVPHMLRLTIGPAHRALLPAAAIGGAAFVLWADLVARTAARPEELHLGVVTATVGAPLIIWLLMRHRDDIGLW